MYTPQAGIFALGTSSHVYLEFDLLDAQRCREFASTISAIREPRTTTGGVNFVIGFRPELWRDIAQIDAPSGVEGFNKEIQGTEGFVLPSTQHDALVWLSGSAYDVVFDMGARLSMISQDKPRCGKKLRVGPTAMIAILPASSMAQRIRRCSTLLAQRSCPKGFLGLPAQCCCFKSGSTRSLSGKHSRSLSRSASSGAPSSIASSCRTSRPTRTSHAQTRMSLGTSFAATCPTGQSMTMARCSLGSAQTKGGFRECLRAWRAW